VKSYNIVLADDHVMVRQGIRNFIEAEGGLHISDEVDDGLELLKLLKTTTPDLIILDIAMPNLRGLEALREIKKNYPHIKVLILTMYGNIEFVRQAVIDGAEGFILKIEPGSELIKAIKTIREGGTYLSPQLSGALMDLAKHRTEEELLTKREREILRGLARGQSAQNIADSLYISVNTVRRHRYNMMQKLNVRNLTDLVKYAISQGYAD
jgi:DNA-binding NarL/FixJ family response regulator